jgi:hypothetical protein
MNSIRRNTEVESWPVIVNNDVQGGTIRQRRFQTTTSFMVSFCVHLTIMLLFSSVWLIGHQANPIRLEANADRSIELDDRLVNLDLPTIEDPLETDEVQLPKVELELEEHISSNPFQPSQSELVSFDSEDMAALSEPRKSSGTEGSSGGSFFGIPATGNRIVYIIDRSPSMQVGKYQTRFQRAVNELLASVNQLQEDQEFQVIMFSFETLKLRIGKNSGFAFATDTNKALLKKKLYSMNLSGGTDPREAIVAALRAEPTCIFLLTDGEFNGEINRNGFYRDKVDAWQLSVKHNKNKCPIHTIGLEDPRTQQQLTRIAESSGGTYVFVPAED